MDINEETLPAFKELLVGFESGFLPTIQEHLIASKQ